MMMLILLRKAKISICRALVNDFSLDGMMGREMRSLTIGVVGTGKIGGRRHPQSQRLWLPDSGIRASPRSGACGAGRIHGP